MKIRKRSRKKQISFRKVRPRAFESFKNQILYEEYEEYLKEVKKRYYIQKAIDDNRLNQRKVRERKKKIREAIEKEIFKVTQRKEIKEKLRLNELLLSKIEKCLMDYEKENIEQLNRLIKNNNIRTENIIKRFIDKYDERTLHEVRKTGRSKRRVSKRDIIKLKMVFGDSMPPLREFIL